MGGRHKAGSRGSGGHSAEARSRAVATLPQQRQPRSSSGGGRFYGGNGADRWLALLSVESRALGVDHETAVLQANLEHKNLDNQGGWGGAHAGLLLVWVESPVRHASIRIHAGGREKGMIMCNIKLAAPTVLVASMMWAGLAFGQISILHSFAGGAADGAGPRGLIRDGSVLYGTTYVGGLDGGTIYRLNTDGTDFRLLHSFTGSPFGTGQNPVGNLALSGTTLYGTTAIPRGTVYKIETDGSDFSTLHAFPFPAPLGQPTGIGSGVVISGDVLYGTTQFGGSNSDPSSSHGGTVFRLRTDGTGFGEVHGFGVNLSEGHNPAPVGLTMSSSGQAIYGMTYEGGLEDQGTIFRVNADGSDFATLHHFTGWLQTDPIDGSGPYNTELQLVGDRLYGVTWHGGDPGSTTYNQGVIFAIDTDGSDFQILHSFGGGMDGRFPQGTLAIHGSTLFGTTTQGGSHDLGTIYQIGLDGSGYSVIHSFTGGPLDGATPWSGGLVVEGDELYGTTIEGGAHGLGVVYTFAIPAPPAGALLMLGGVILTRRNRARQHCP